MSEQKQNNPEIDLLYFFKPLGTVFKKAGNVLDYANRKLHANKVLFIVIIMIFTLAGYSLRYVLKPSYKTQGIFVSNILPGKYCSILLENLNKIIGEKNQPVLSNQLKVSNAVAGDIQAIELSAMRDTFLIDRRDSAISLFNISLTLSSVQHLDSIQWALVNYLENNEYTTKRKEARRRSLQAMKTNLNNKLQGLDSLKKLVNSSIVPRSQGQGIILGEPIDPVSIYEAEVGYYRELLNIDQSLATIDNIEVLQPFFKINQTNYPRYNWIMMQFFLWSLVVALIFVFVFGREPK